MTPTFFSDEFLVNTTTPSFQGETSVTGLANGRFLVTWMDASQTGGDISGRAIRAQIFNADGSKAGAELLVNTITANHQEVPTCIALFDGGFAIAWQDSSKSGGDTSGSAVRAQIYKPDGSKAGAELLVNTTASGFQTAPTITQLTNGRLVVAWGDTSGTAPDTQGTAIRGQILDVNSGKIGAEFVVNTTFNGDQFRPSIAALAGGRFVVTYSDASNTGDDTDGVAVRAQIFEANGSKTQILVNTTATGNQDEPTVAGLANGGFVVAWSDGSKSGGDTSDDAIRAQIFNANGGKIGNELLVNTTTTGDQTLSVVAGLPDGRFIIAWTDASQSGGDTSQTAIRAQVFNANGTKSGGEFLVNSSTAGKQQEPTITVLADGRVVIAWEDNSKSPGDNSDAAVRAQIVDPRLEGVKLTGSDLADDWVGTPFKDVMKGKSGADTFDGGAGKDKLEGGKGPDLLTGGLNADRFIFKSIKDSTKKNPDSILDFSRKEGDKIVLSAVDAVKGGKDNKFDYIGKDKFSGDAGELKYKVKQGDALVMGDVTGNGRADFAILVEDVTKLKDGDFVL